MNALFIYGMNLIVLAIFFAVYHVLPTFEGIIMFLIFSLLLYVLAVAFSFLTAPFYVRFRDLSMVWEVLLTVLMYASPIIYPLTMMPMHIQKLMLLNPFAFIINFAKQGLINGAYTTVWHFTMLFIGMLIAIVLASNQIILTTLLGTIVGVFLCITAKCIIFSVLILLIQHNISKLIDIDLLRKKFKNKIN